MRFSHQHEEGRGLDATSRGSRRGSDEHQYHQHQESRSAHGAHRHTGESGSSGRHALEERIQPREAAALGNSQQQHAGYYQPDSCCRDGLGLQRPPFRRLSRYQLGYHEKSQTSEYYQRTGDNTEPCIVLIVHKAVAVSQHIESCVVESGYGMEYADSHSSCKGIIMAE